MPHSFPRRGLFGAAAALLSADAWAFGDASKFIPAAVQHGPRWDARLAGLRRLSWELERRTSVEVSLETRAMTLTSPKLFEQPFLYWGGEGDLPPLSADELEALRRYLTFGGFLFIDANDGSRGSGFDAAIRRELGRVLPRAPLSPLPSTHVVFKSFFLLDTAPGRLLVKPDLEGARVGGRVAVMYSQNDVLGALQRDDGGSWTFDVAPGGDRQREYAVRLAVNVAMYALCLDYKDDAVHLPLILKKRR